MDAKRDLRGEPEIGHVLVQQHFLRPLTWWARWMEVLAPFPPELESNETDRPTPDLLPRGHNANNEARSERNQEIGLRWASGKEAHGTAK